MACSRQICDFCKQPAKYDGKTGIGPYAFMCEEHFQQYGIQAPGLFTVLEPEIVATKCCAHCGLDKPITEFYKYVDHAGTSRHRNECKACNLAERKANSMRRVRR